MDEEKRKTIVNEIRHWRRSKLLPEQYCDFLLNLYADGQGKTEAEGPGLLAEHSTSRTGPGNRNGWLNSLLGLAFLLAIVYFIYNFNAFPVLLQISISSIFILICYAVGLKQKQRQPVVSYIGLGAGAFLTLLIGMRLMEQHGWDSASSMVGFLFCSCVTWIALGWLARNFIFSFCGWIGLILIYGWMLYGKLGEITWLAAQASWLPWAVVFGWLGWLVQHRNKQAGLLFLVLAVLVWFMPEAFLLYANGLSSTIPLYAGGKLFAAAAAGFTTRKTWIEWVTYEKGMG